MKKLSLMLMLLLSTNVLAESSVTRTMIINLHNHSGSTPRIVYEVDGQNYIHFAKQPQLLAQGDSQIEFSISAPKSELLNAHVTWSIDNIPFHHHGIRIRYGANKNLRGMDAITASKTTQTCQKYPDSFFALGDFTPHHIPFSNITRQDVGVERCSH